MQKKIEIIIAEDSTLFRNAVAAELEEFNIRTIAHAANGKELLKLLKTNDPELVLLDLEMPVMNGNDAFTAIRKKFPKLKVIIMSQYDDNGLMENYMARGACGFIPKNFLSNDIEILSNGIKTVSGNGTYFYSYDPKSKVKYTRREAEVIPLIFEGKTNKEIAVELKLGEKSIEKHRKNIYQKTASRNMAVFITKSVKKGLEYLGKK